MSSGVAGGGSLRQIVEQLHVLFADVLQHEVVDRHAAFVEGLLDADLVGEQRRDALIVGRLQRRLHDEDGQEQRQRDHHRVGWRGRRPIAVRSSDSTTTMRVNEVTMIRIDGASDSTVIRPTSWTARSVSRFVAEIDRDVLRERRPPPANRR